MDDSDFGSVGANSIDSEHILPKGSDCNDCDKPETPCDDEPKKEDCPAPVNSCANGIYWPLIIFVILAIIALIAIIFSKQFDGVNKGWAFFIALVVVLIWALIIYFFCKSGMQAIAWFLLLLPIAVAIFWALSVFLAGATCGGCPNTAVCGNPTGVTPPPAPCA